MAGSRPYGEIRLYSIPAANKRVLGVLKKDGDRDILILPDGTYAVVGDLRLKHRAATDPKYFRGYDGSPMENLVGYFTGNLALKGENPQLDLSSSARLFLAECEERGIEPIKDKIAYYDTADGIACRGYKLDITEAHILEGTRIIDDYAFRCCRKLSDIELPDTLQVIGKHAFEQCTRPEVISLPSSLRVISEYAFYSSALEEISIADGLVSLGDYALSRTNIGVLKLPDTVTSIGCGMLAECPELAVLDMHTGVQTIPKDMCLNCKNLEYLNLPACCNSFEDNAFSGCRSLEHFTLIAKLIYSGKNVFQGCTALERVNYQKYNTDLIQALVADSHKIVRKCDTYLKCVCLS